MKTESRAENPELGAAPGAPEPVVAVLCGGTSAEREVSLGSGLACAVALARSFPTRMFDVTADALPDGLDPARHVVFSTLHGTFGEDGGMQGLLDIAGCEFAGCDAASSELTMDKTRTKDAVAAAGMKVILGIKFAAAAKPTADEVVARIGEKVVLKPNAEGSSVGLQMIGSRAELAEALAAVREGDWLVEKRIFGRELAVGVMNGHAMGVVEIRPKSGIYDYASKYTKGLTEYFAPAPLGETLTAAVRAAAERAFAVCGCRDFARVDFMVGTGDEFYLLEINTLPGMKETSLLPMSARCEGLDFTGLVREMVAPALRRFQAAAHASP
ncbi:MAG TPA: D-alanine--D-alanine ligase [Opitutus sp.]|nr:D-alanine--D-alanine ligase [Opitutus sp.]